MNARHIRPAISSAILLLASASILFNAAAVIRAAEQIDVSKLKRGEKLEARFGTKWEPVEFHEAINDQVVHVNRKGWKVPVGAFVHNLRRRTKAGNAAVLPAEDPFATEEERVAARKPRIWQSGNFKTEATLLRRADDTAVLKRADGTEISVPLARLSPNDRSYVDGIYPPSGESPSNREKPPEQSAPDDIKITKTHLGAAQVIDLTPTETWNYEPDPAPKATPLRNVRVPLRTPDSIFDDPTGLILLPAESKAIAVSVNHSPSLERYRATVQVCDLKTGKLAGFGVFADGAAPIDVSPDGKMVLARTVGREHGAGTQLRLYQRNGDQVTPAAAWIPCAGTAGAAATLGMEVIWARFLDPDHVIVMSRGGILSLWNTDELRPIYQATGRALAPPAISPGGRYVALANPDGIAILQSSDGTVVGTLPADTHAFNNLLAFSPDGRRLALVQHPGRVRVWDLASRELQRDFPASVPPSRSEGASLFWVNEDYLLASGTTLIDVKHHARVWSYTGLGPIAGIRDGRLWYLEAVPHRDPILASAELPSRVIRERWADLPADAGLIIKPGMEFAIELPSDGSAKQVRQHLAKSLAERGMKAVPEAELRLVGKITRGETRKIEYRPFGARRGQTSTHTVTESNLSLAWKLGSDTLWQHTSRIAAPAFVHPKQGQTIDQAIAESMQKDTSVFREIWIPVHVARPNPDATSDTSSAPAG